MIKRYFLKQKTRLVLLFVLKIIASMVGLFIPWAFAHIVNEVIPLNSDREIVKWCSFMLIFAFINLFSNIVTFYVNAKFSVKLSKDIRSDVFERACQLDCKEVDEFGVSSLTSRLTSDILSVQTFSSKLMTKGVATITTFVGSVFTASILDLKLAFIMFITVPLIMITVYFTTTIGLNRFTITRKANDNLVKSIRENVLGIRVIKSLSKYEYEKKKFENVSDELMKKNISASLVDAIGTPTMKFIINIGMVATLLMGAYFVSIGTSNIADLIAFMSYFTMVLTSLVGIGSMFTMYSKAGAAAKRIDEVLQTENKKYIGNSDKFESNYHIEFKNVTFHYDDSGKILDNVSFSVKKGQTLGIIGVTGAGKTTIINLLLRLYEPNEGEILINSKTINNYTSEELYKMFGVVFQSDVIFSESVSENIAFGRDISQNDIKNAAKSAQAETFIGKLKNDYEARINIRGQNISGGEKQRLLISRALAGNPEILVLDDSMSALDYKTDSLLRADLSTKFENTTKILVSSRVATIMNAEQIIVVDEGKVVSSGNHEQLIVNSKLYREISELQLGDSKIYA